jgi:hypothetical protein
VYGKKRKKEKDIVGLFMQRYGVTPWKNKREIVLLRGTGCRWARCRFCDYHLDASADKAANFALNQEVLEAVDGRYARLEVVNSGSFPELGQDTLCLIRSVCARRGIRTVHFECHWQQRSEIKALRRFFAEQGIIVKIKTGVEGFDPAWRQTLDKGMGWESPAEIAEFFQEVCLLFGLPGQTSALMLADLRTGLRYFERVCVNMMQPNSTGFAPDATVSAAFYRDIYPLYSDDERVDILATPEGFGIGGLDA